MTHLRITTHKRMEENGSFVYNHEFLIPIEELKIDKGLIYLIPSDTNKKYREILQNIDSDFHLTQMHFITSSKKGYYNGNLSHYSIIL